MEEQYAIIYVTTKNQEEAEKIADHLLRRKLVACANMIDGIKSTYWWRGKIEKDTECLMILKTKASLYTSIEKYIKEHHSYKVPEIILVPIHKGNPDYLSGLRRMWKTSDI